MARQRNILSARRAETLRDPGRHKDGGGLYLVIDGGEASARRRWVYIFTLNGQRREMGLGGHPAISLAEARQYRDNAERLVRSGIDPIKERDKAKVGPAKKLTFGECADDYIATHESSWFNQKHCDQWRMTLTVHAAQLREIPVDEVGTEDVLAVLKPRWLTIPETAQRLRGRIETVLDAARSKGLIDPNVANPARWKGHLEFLLPKASKLTRGHHKAMSRTLMKSFIGKLRELQKDSLAASALEFTLLTCVRTSEALKASWSEIDFDQMIWTIPAIRTKTKKSENRIPLTPRMISILRDMQAKKVSDFIFPGGKANRPLSNMAMAMVLKRMKITDATVHGFRSTFRDWVGDDTNFSSEVAEASLHHKEGDKVVIAYRRGDALQKRRELLEAWTEFCEP
jgi:integrase